MLELIDGRDLTGPVHIQRPQPVSRGEDPSADVRAIVDDVRLNGDSALLTYTERFDGARLDASSLRVDPDVIAQARNLVRPELLDALEVMRERLRRTCERQKQE
ncbi:MAG: histidinol dehydrogenase, partial [Actinomycetota bacterium]